MAEIADWELATTAGGQMLGLTYFTMSEDTEAAEFVVQRSQHKTLTHLPGLLNSRIASSRKRTPNEFRLGLLLEETGPTANAFET